MTLVLLLAVFKVDEGYIYEGKLSYETETIDLGSLEPTKTKLYMNIGNPAEAFNFAKMPNDGVGTCKNGVYHEPLYKCSSYGSGKYARKETHVKR